MNELIIEQKVREMILYGYAVLRQLPRSERHVLSAEIRAGLAAGAINLAQCNPVIESWIAHASHANTYRLRKALFSDPMITGATK